MKDAVRPEWRTLPDLSCEYWLYVCKHARIARVYEVDGRSWAAQGRELDTANGSRMGEYRTLVK